MKERTYIAIDLKSFYASVECIERGLDPMTTNLVVADDSRTDKTICLAVTPSLKKYGLSGRSRLFEVKQKVAQIKNETGVDLEYIIAVPRMALYIKYSADIYDIYLKYFSPEDIHIYSIDEVFIDLTTYLPFYNTAAFSLCKKVVDDIFDSIGITATVGIAPNLFLCKVAMDIVAKHLPSDERGAKIAILDEMEFNIRILFFLCAVSMGISLVPLSLYLPFAYRFNSQVCGIVLAIAYAVAMICLPIIFLISIMGELLGMYPAISTSLIAMAVIIAIFLLSWFISVKIYEKRDL